MLDDDKPMTCVLSAKGSMRNISTNLHLPWFSSVSRSFEQKIECGLAEKWLWFCCLRHRHGRRLGPDAHRREAQSGDVVGPRAGHLHRQGPRPGRRQKRQRLRRRRRQQTDGATQVDVAGRRRRLGRSVDGRQGRRNGRLWLGDAQSRDDGRLGRFGGAVEGAGRFDDQLGPFRFVRNGRLRQRRRRLRRLRRPKWWRSRWWRSRWHQRRWSRRNSRLFQGVWTGVLNWQLTWTRVHRTSSRPPS